METSTPTDVLYSWNAPERIPVDRGNRWNIVAGTAVVIAAIGSILTGAWSFTVVIVMGSALYATALRRPSMERLVQLRGIGIEVAGKLTPWNQCSGFWIYGHDPYATMHIETRSGWNREITVVLSAADYLRIAEIMSAFIPYRAERREKLLDYIIRVCKL